MARNYFIIFSGVLFLLSCAQVGTISGGHEDVSAPRPIEESIQPPNGTVNFSGKNVEITFDEFFKLSNPSQSIKIVPPHAEVRASIKKKKLLLEWSEDLKANTTYAIYLNKAVKDISEGNDSLIQYVFSTGENIDSVSFVTTVIDAWTGTPIKECIVALYDLEDSLIRSFAETSDDGIAHLRYLKSGKYRAVAFKDENGDLKFQAHERIGYPKLGIVNLIDDYNDSIVVRLFTPKLSPKIRTKTIVGPGMIVLGATADFENYSIYFNSEEVHPSHIKAERKDSLIIFHQPTEENNFELVLNSEALNDTLKLRHTERSRSVPITISSKNKSNLFAPSENISFSLNDFITEVDTSQIRLVNKSDSTIISNYTFELAYNELHFHFSREDLSTLTFAFDDSAIKTLNGWTMKAEFDIQLNEARKYGSILVDLKSYSEPIILHVMQNSKTIKTIPIQKFDEIFTLSELLPGDYSFRVVRDENGNQLWDVGDATVFSQPENVDLYSTLTKVRANWTVELSLIPVK